GRRRRQVGEDRAVEDLLDEPGAEHRGRDPEGEVPALELLLEVLLRDSAGPGVWVTADHEEGVDATVGRAVALALEADLPHGAIRLDERRHVVLDRRESEVAGHAEQGIRGWAGAPDLWLGVASGAAHEVEPRPDAIGDRFFFRELVASGIEHVLL